MSRRTVIQVDITRVRVYGPVGLDPQDEDAVRAWVADNRYRVLEAALEDDGVVELLVSDAWEAWADEA